ncbi:MAG: protein translocase subunit SecD, partial [Armatimonadetes bacterium]|nr:protein translocase subunit SecD [Armatimonadota bacterium]
TIDNRDEILAIVLDDKIISAPKIEEPITGGSGVIRGGFKNMAEGRILANLLNSGALPIAMRTAEVQTVGATLGQESINRSIIAGLIGLGLVLVFMLAYYWLPGVLACIALLFYSSLTFALFKGAGIFPPIVLDLPGITGFILSVGMAVDANILIFERLREELRAGKNLHAAIDAGFNRAFSSILDSNVTTWIVCAILIWLGAPIIRGFAITLALGVAVSMFTAITVTRTMLHLVVNMEWARKEGAYGLNVGWLAMAFPASRQGAILRVYDKRKAYFGFSIGLMVLTLLFCALTPFGKGLKQGIDFTGGSVIETAFRQQTVTREEVLARVKEAGAADAVVSIGLDEKPWTRVALEATNVDQVGEEGLKRRLAAVRGYDPESFTSTREGNTLKANSVYIGPVTEDAIRTELNRSGEEGDDRPSLTSLKVTATEEAHTGGNATRIAEIRIQDLTPELASRVRTALAGLAGGIIQPLYAESFIGPTVAREITRNAFASVFVASLAIILYLAFRFAIGGFLNGLKFGVCAVIALVHDVGATIGLFALMGGIAGWEIDSL